MESQVRQDILSVGKRLFIQHGYHGLSMREIAENVGVSKAALYYHFSDKQELFLAILGTSLKQIETVLSDLIAENTNPQLQIQTFVNWILSQPAEERAVIRLASQELNQLDKDARKNFEMEYYRGFIDKLTRIFENGIAMGIFRSIDPRLMTWSLLGMMFPYFDSIHTKILQPLDQVADQLVELFFRGVIFPCDRK